ncbi:DUF2490 domain-containing protein [Psychroserpens mesophilus]|uniref:DUF2490 domain-containing protein n=1 Tax=Psychroserpens mesophilus TaxID=325473 RepID=UPI000A04E127|nr:DUF2490 domain-containing protein [Psychroserpens mesophilus]
MKCYFLSIVFCIASLLSFGQINPEKRTGTWYMLFTTHQVSDKLSINAGMQLRYYELISNYNLDFFYTGLSYAINPKVNLTFNYGYLDIDRSIEFTDVTNTIEHRFYEQITYKHDLLKLPIRHRFRLEHRFLHDVFENENQNRIRYRLGTSVKLNTQFYITANNEFFLNLEGETFRENRLYTAFGIIINKNIKLEIGYMNQHINNLDLDRLQFGLYITTDFRIKKPD